MELDLNLEITEDDSKAKERVEKAKVRKKASKFQPTWEQVWEGYDRPVRRRNKETGKMEDVVVHKKGIWELKGSLGADREWLTEVKHAIEDGVLELVDPVTKEEIPVHKFSKSKAKELYAVLEERKREQRLKEIVETKPKNYFLIQEADQLEKVVEDLKKERETGLDTETTGLDVYVDEMVGISITLPKNDYHVYIPFGHTTGEKQLPRGFVLSKLAPYLLDRKSKKFLHNAKFDKHMFMRHGTNIYGTIHCTQIAMKVLNENEPSYTLDALTSKYRHLIGIEESAYSFGQLFGKNAPFAEVPLEVATVYACKDTHATYLLGKWQEKFFNSKGREGLNHIFYDVETPLLPVVTDMERTGMVLDMEFAHEYSKELSEHLERLSDEIHEVMGDINTNSPQQLAEWLYDVRGLEDISKKRSTDKATLKALADQEPVLKTLLEYRDLHKLHSTYISALPEKVKSDGRVHGQFNQVATDTGRFSSQEPNMQNLPDRARKLFIAPEGKMIVSIDFSQIEPRVLSHFSGDEELQRPYREGGDLYSTLASKTFKKPIEECGDGSVYRSMMKTGLLAVMYGTSMWTLSQQLGITVEEAEQFIDDFFEAYPKVEAWIQSVHEHVKENEYVETLYGRKRRFPHHKQEAILYDKLAKRIKDLLGVDKIPSDFWDKKKYPQLPYKLKRQFQDVKRPVERVRRQAVNAIIQGSSADIMKKAMLRVAEYNKTKGWNLMATVHDEILNLVDLEVSHEELIELNDCMRLAVELDVPLKTDMEIMLSWGSSFKFDTNRKVYFLKNEKTGELLFETEDLEEAIEKYEEVAK